MLYPNWHTIEKCCWAEELQAIFLDPIVRDNRETTETLQKRDLLTNKNESKQKKSHLISIGGSIEAIKNPRKLKVNQNRNQKSTKIGKNVRSRLKKHKLQISVFRKQMRCFNFIWLTEKMHASTL